MSVHADLSGADLHEPKGVASAAAGTVYVSDGSGSGNWTDPASVNKNQNKVLCYATFDDISTAGSQFIVPGIAGAITKILVVIDNAISVADTAMTFKIGGTLITSGGITITQSGSAAGSIFNSNPSAARTVTSTQAVEIISDGGSTTTCKAKITFVMDVS